MIICEKCKRTFLYEYYPACCHKHQTAYAGCPWWDTHTMGKNPAEESNEDESPYVGFTAELDEHGRLQETGKIKLSEVEAVTRKSGGSQNYYRTYVKNPTTGNIPYFAECNDIIEALGLNYAEATILKAIWRMAAYRRGLQREDPPAYDAEKIEFFAKRVRIQNADEE